MLATEQIRPYRDWLGLASRKGLYSHYDLLGISPLEQDAAAIRLAARQQRLRLAAAAEGAPLPLVQKVLAEIDRAEQCLLSPESRCRYDRRLRGEKPLAPRWRMSLPAKPPPTALPTEGSTAETEALEGITTPIGPR